MRYELTNDEWAAIKPMLPNKPRGVPRVDERPANSILPLVIPSSSLGLPLGDLDIAQQAGPSGRVRFRNRRDAHCEISHFDP